MITRRQAIKRIGGLAGMAAMPKFLSACSDEAGGPVGITTYVYLMLENRTYDHALGARSWKEGKAGDGLRDGITQLDANNVAVGLFEPNPQMVTQMCVSDDPHHGWGASREQWKHPTLPTTETNNGFLKVHQADYAGVEPMQYLTRSHQPISWALADAYTSCDRWFASVLGPTLPNRAYFLAGTSAGFRSNDPIYNPTRDDGTPRPPLEIDTIFHKLRKANVEWATYYGNLPIAAALNMRMAESHKLTTEELMNGVRPFGDSDYAEGRFFVDAAEGKLPPVVYIEPAFYVNDDHPPTHPMLAQVLIASIYTALATSPQWKNVLFVVTYDEHGGFYDHVSPPTLPPEADDTKDRFPTDDDGTPNGDGDFNQLGFRVPALVIGPYVKQNYVSSVQYDHTSAIKTLENAFELEPMSARVTHANDLSDCIDMDRLERGDWAPPIELPMFEFGRDSRGELLSVTVDGVTWPYTKAVCAPGLTSFRTDPMNEAANQLPEIFEGYDLRDSEDRYLASIDRYLQENQHKVGVAGRIRESKTR